MNSEKAIKAIQRKLDSLLPLKESNQFNIWQKETVLTLINIYSEKDKRVLSFESNKSYHYVDRFSEAKVEAEAILKSLIIDIEDFGLPQLTQPKKEDNFSFVVNQHNSQNQSTSVSINIDFIIEILKGELRTSEINEVKEILESDIEPKEKKKKFIDKIKSFGSDVASNILANLLTNPQVYEQIGKIL